MICRWLKEYEKNVTDAFNPKKRIGNKFAALNSGKYLTENEMLKLQIAKLEIENERLKKGYWVKGAGQNIVNGHWNATKPLEIVVSDMTCIYRKGIRWKWTYLLDVFNNEIIASSITNKIGSNLPYYHCLDVLIAKTKEQTYPVTLHTDQGSVYSSFGFYQAYKNYTNIKRSMSRAGTPTDNPIIESLNGWIKEEPKIDFNLKSVDNLSCLIKKYVEYFNNERLSYKLHYKTPIQYKLEKGFI